MSVYLVGRYITGENRIMSNIKTLQQKIGVTDDGIIGAKTIKAFRDKYDLSAEQAAHFFANVHHESGAFRISEENLNYTSADRIRAVWPSRFPTIESATPFVRNPQGLANKVYNGRMGNSNGGDDGWRYRGRGALQLTGKNNYTDFAKYMNDERILTSPELVATTYYWDSALYFFDRNKVWDLAKGLQQSHIEAVRKKINGGLIGVNEVRALIQKYYKK